MSDVLEIFEQALQNPKTCAPLNEWLDKRLDEKLGALDAKWNDRFEKMDAKWEDRLQKLDAKWEDRFQKMEAKFNDRLDKMEAKWESKLNEHLNIVQLLKDQNKALAESLAAFHADLRNGTLRYHTAPAAKE